MKLDRMRCDPADPARVFARSAIARIWLVARAIRERGAGQRVNAFTLAMDLECCNRTISRDIEFLRDRLGHDIQYIASERTFVYQAVPALTYL